MHSCLIVYPLSCLFNSQEEEEEEEIPVVPTEPAIQQQPQQVEPQTGPQGSKPPVRQGDLKGGSRATSPVTSSLGGHSIVAKRATSPKVPKPKANTLSRGNSPLGSRATSPVANSRATSPAAAGPTPSGSQKPSNKRKATDDLSPGSPTPGTPNGIPPKPKKRKALGTGSGPAAIPAGELEDKMVIDWLKNTPNASTRDCIQHFTPYLTDEAKKSKFTALVKEVAQLKGGVLVLRNAYRGSAAPSPVPTPVA